MSCLGRERMFEYFSRTLNIPTTLIRLFYACELRYGVVVDPFGHTWSLATHQRDLSPGEIAKGMEAAFAQPVS